MSEEFSFQISSPIGSDLVDFESRNTKQMTCPLCNCNVLPKFEAILSEIQIELPTEEILKTNASLPGESLSWCWKIDDMWKFDNIGFTRPVPGSDGQLKNYKFVICGGCDRGILGLQWINTGDNNIYIAPGRVSYK